MNARRLCAIALIAFAVTLAACGDGETAVRVIVDGTVQPTPSSVATEVATPSPTPAPVPFTPTPPPSTIDPDDLRGFLWPVEGACLPDRDVLMPNSPREYRSGTHEGIDWYDLSGCARVAEGTAVVAMYDGVVVRADSEYEGLTARTLAALEARVAECACSEPDVFDAFRGMQVWIDHGNGVLTRYAHLGSIDETTYVGAEVRRGQHIAGVGESGTPESVREPGTEMHVHAEIRIEESFLGAGLPAAEVRALYERAFAPVQQ